MRPERLELAGFGVFRESTAIDFSAADLFALTGATGSGKSTVVDAVIFALYGSVPRLDDKRQVAPAISEGKVEARVRLDFAVGDGRYTALRIARRKTRGAAGATGASTVEARLERIDSATGDVEVLAGTAEELTAAVERLIGLTYEHFITCVVLPQGDFQRFLHQKPAARQDLLVELLDLGVYARMASAARSRAALARGERGVVQRELTKLATYTPEQRAEIEAEVAGLEALLTRIDEALPVVERLTRHADTARAAADAAVAKVALLDGVRRSEGVEQLAGELAAAALGVEAADADEAATAAALAVAEAELEAQPDRSVLAAAARDHELRGSEAERIAKGEQVLCTAVETEAAVVADLAMARTIHVDARAARDEAQLTNRAHALAIGLSVGAPCPVCLRSIDELPHHELGDLEKLTEAEARARQAADEVEARRRDLTARRLRAEDLLAELRGRVAELDERLVAFGDPASVRSQLAAIDQAGDAVRTLRADEQGARRRRQGAERRLGDLRQAEREARRRFDDARDRVAALDPPAAERSDLVADWEALTVWVAGELPRQRAEAQQARASADAADTERRRHRDELHEACAQMGLDVGRRPVRDVVVEHLSEGRADLVSLDDALELAVELRARDEDLARTEQTAALLATHLRSTGFERWVLDEVLRRLVAGATEILHELSNGTYSLTFDARSNFSVIDHANADAVRSARTLSGGETFLASLALALSLSDEVAQLAATGPVRLESIFLDEGFGTLDPDTLDTVATAIEELGARGRLVGLVTHVRDLAERMPVRYEVTRHGNSSTVARVDA